MTEEVQVLAEVDSAPTTDVTHTPEVIAAYQAAQTRDIQGTP